MELIDCSKCVRCSNVHSNDNMVCDAYGDSSVMMCIFCLLKVTKGLDPRFKAIEDSPTTSGYSFIFSSEEEEYSNYLKT